MLNRSLAFVLVLGTFWAFVTTYVGIVTILQTENWVAFGTGLIGSALICVLNFYTSRVWQNYDDDFGKSNDSSVVNWMVRVFWTGAILLNYYASYVTHVRFTQQASAELGAKFVIVFITALLVCSPMTLGKVWEERRKLALAEQRLKQQ